MKTTKKLGIWMDHTYAHLMEFSASPVETKVIASEFTHQEKMESLSKSENIMHNKKQHEQAEYYKKLGESIRNYQEVIVFGPTRAKSELLNVLRVDNRFEKIKIELKQTDKLTENQQHAFVRDYFTQI
jgi:Lhr-like helicase